MPSSHGLGHPRCVKKLQLPPQVEYAALPLLKGRKGSSQTPKEVQSELITGVAGLLSPGALFPTNSRPGAVLPYPRTPDLDDDPASPATVSHTPC